MTLDITPVSRPRPRGRLRTTRQRVVDGLLDLGDLAVGEFAELPAPASGKPAVVLHAEAYQEREAAVGHVRDAAYPAGGAVEYGEEAEFLAKVGNSLHEEINV